MHALSGCLRTLYTETGQAGATQNWASGSSMTPVSTAPTAEPHSKLLPFPINSTWVCWVVWFGFHRLKLQQTTTVRKLPMKINKKSITCHVTRKHWQLTSSLFSISNEPHYSKTTHKWSLLDSYKCTWISWIKHSFTWNGKKYYLTWYLEKAH